MVVSAPEQSVPESAVAALEQGNVIEAIKIVRAVHGLGLKESKDAVDGYLRNNPDIRQRLSDSSSEATRTIGRWAALLVGVGIAVWFMLR